MSEVISAARTPVTAGIGLTSVEGLRLHNVAAEAATLHDMPGVRLAQSEQTAARVAHLPPEKRSRLNQLAWIEGIEFSSGVIEAEIAGDPEPGAVEAARGFVGIAFRLQEDLKTYDAFYLRPTNGRADDQERRNHSAQYISHPEWPWFRLRKETPSKYEAYVDLVPGEWTKIKIEVCGDNGAALRPRQRTADADRQRRQVRRERRRGGRAVDRPRNRRALPGPDGPGTNRKVV